MTFNPADAGATIVFSNSNRTIANTDPSYASAPGSRSTAIAAVAGRHYFEMVAGADSTGVGIANPSASVSAYPSTTNELVLYVDSGELTHNGVVLGTFAGGGQLGDVWGFVVDQINDKVDVRKNGGSWLLSYDPATGTGGWTNTITGNLHFAAWIFGDFGGTTVRTSSADWGTPAPALFTQWGEPYVLSVASSTGSSTTVATGVSIAAASFAVAGTSTVAGVNGSTGGGAGSVGDDLKQEDGFFLLQEDGSYLLLEFNSIVSGAFSSAGSSTTSGVGASVSGVVSATFAVSGVSGSYPALRGVSGEVLTGVGGEPLFSSIFSPVEWDGTSLGLVGSTFAVSGTSSAAAISPNATVPSVATAVGSATVSGVGSSRAASSFGVVATSSASGITGASVVTAAFTSIGSTTTRMVGRTIIPAVGSAAGSSSTDFFASTTNFNLPSDEAVIVPAEDRTVLVAFESRWRVA